MQYGTPWIHSTWLLRLKKYWVIQFRSLLPSLSLYPGCPSSPGNQAGIKQKVCPMILYYFVIIYELGKEIPQVWPSSMLSQSPSQKSQSKPTGKGKGKFAELLFLNYWNGVVWHGLKTPVCSLISSVLIRCLLLFELSDARNEIRAN